jgi:hypothetical protein
MADTTITQHLIVHTPKGKLVHEDRTDDGRVGVIDDNEKFVLIQTNGQSRPASDTEAYAIFQNMGLDVASLEDLVGMHTKDLRSCIKALIGIQFAFEHNEPLYNIRHDLQQANDLHIPLDHLRLAKNSLDEAKEILDPVTRAYEYSGCRKKRCLEDAAAYLKLAHAEYRRRYGRGASYRSSNGFSQY